MKLKLLALFIGLLSLSHVLHADNIDSLNQIIESPKSNIETKSKTYVTLTEYYSQKNQDSARFYIHNLSILANQSKESIALYRYNFIKGKLYRLYDENQSLDSIIRYLDIALRHANKTESSAKNKVNAYYQKSYYYLMHGQVDSSQKYGELSLDLAKKNGDAKDIGVSATSLGHTMYYGLNDYSQAVYYYQMADSCYQLKGDIKDLAYNKVNLGAIFLNLSENEKAKKYFEEALRIYQQLNDEYYIYFVKDRLAEIDYENEKYEKALTTFQKSYAYYKRTNNKLRVIENAGHLARVFKELNQPDSCIAYARIGLESAKENGDTERLIWALSQMGQSYLNKNDYVTSYNYSSQAYALSNKGQYIQSKIAALHYMHQAQAKLKNYTKAYAHSAEYIKLYDKIQIKRNADRTTELEKKYQTAQKEKELALANQQKQFFKKQRWLFAIIAALFGALILLYIRHRNKKKVKELQAEMAEVQLASLKSQMNPHFMFNSINSIKGLIINEAAEAAADQLTRFSKIMRSTLNYSSEKEIPLKDEIEFITTYSELERFKGNIPVALNFDIAPAIDAEATKIIPFLIQPFVENSFKHAFHEIGGRTPEINIRFKEQGAYLQIEIDDNGIGEKIENASVHVSKGTELVQKRLELHNKEKENVSINFRGTDKGTLVKLKIKK